MENLLNDVEIRVLGCLVEKELATPEYYPLTLNALANACNQRSNRDPVMELEEAQVVRALDTLRARQLALLSAEGVRAAKYCHNLAARHHLEPPELALLAELLLRGPQTMGELRARAERMHPFADLAAVEEALAELTDREPPLAMQLPRQPGRKECRYAQLLSGMPEVETAPGAPPEGARLKVQAEDERIGNLEAEVAALREEMERLREALERFKAQFE